MFPQSGHEIDEIAGLVAIIQLMNQNDFPCVAHRAGRPRESEQVFPFGDTADSPRLNRARPNLRIAQDSKELTEAGYLFLENASESLRCDIPPREPCSSRGDDDINVDVFYPFPEDDLDRIGLITNDVACDRSMTSSSYLSGKEIARSISRGITSIQHCKNCNIY